MRSGLREALAKQHKHITIMFGNIVMKAETETKLIVDCHGGTEVNLVTALGFYSMFSSLESLLNLEQKHDKSRPSLWKCFREFCKPSKNILESGGKRSRRK